MFHQIQQAVEPQLFIGNVVENWHIITQNLSEANRRRKPQLFELIT
jgi:hypothetical protein